MTKNEKTNVGKKYFKVINKCFPLNNKLHKIFNKITAKISYRCIPNVKSIIKGSNRKLWKCNNETGNEEKCNSTRKATCPLEGKCLAKDIEYGYQATVICRNVEETYVGLTWLIFQHFHRFGLVYNILGIKLSGAVSDRHRNSVDWSLTQDQLVHKISFKFIHNCLHNPASKFITLSSTWLWCHHFRMSIPIDTKM